jgi:hypothetical protein
LAFVSDAIAYLAKSEQIKANQNDFHAELYCYRPENLLILSYKGSVQPTTSFDHNMIDDWVDTNLGQHLRTVPNQYMLAMDDADLINRRWSEGSFDNVCGEGRPKFVLTGHSKGGGQAQFAGYYFSLDAIVFNSDPPDPYIFSEWASMEETPILLQWIRAAGRTIQSVYNCVSPSPIPDSLMSYYQSGKVTDVRMVNDKIVTNLLPYCDFPHASFEWLSDTSNCSANNGHSIDTVIRELKECGLDKPRQRP